MGNKHIAPEWASSRRGRGSREAMADDAHGVDVHKKFTKVWFDKKRKKWEVMWNFIKIPPQ